MGSICSGDECTVWERGLRKRLKPEFYEDLDKAKMGKNAISKITRKPENKGK